jgi:F0F1-type ATP synthase membrane subunit b/b'
MNEMWSKLLESNVINFILFVGALVFFAGKAISQALQSRNEDLQAELSKAEERSRLAEEQLRISEKELKSFKSSLELRQKESEKRIELLKQDLIEEREKKKVLFDSKFKREIEQMKSNLKLEMQMQLAEQALKLSETMIRNKFTSTAERDNFNRESLKQTIEFIKLHPEPTRN